MSLWVEPLGKDEGLVKAFPDVFFLGKAYDGTRPSLNEDQSAASFDAVHDQCCCVSAACCSTCLIKCRGTVR